MTDIQKMYEFCDESLYESPYSPYSDMEPIKDSKKIVDMLYNCTILEVEIVESFMCITFDKNNYFYVDIDRQDYVESELLNNKYPHLKTFIFYVCPELIPYQHFNFIPLSSHLDTIILPHIVGLDDTEFTNPYHLVITSQIESIKELRDYLWLNVYEGGIHSDLFCMVTPDDNLDELSVYDLILSIKIGDEKLSTEYLSYLIEGDEDGEDNPLNTAENLAKLIPLIFPNINFN